MPWLAVLCAGLAAAPASGGGVGVGLLAEAHCGAVVGALTPVHAGRGRRSSSLIRSWPRTHLGQCEVWSQGRSQWGQSIAEPSAPNSLGVSHQSQQRAVRFTLPPRDGGFRRWCRCGARLSVAARPPAQGLFSPLTSNVRMLRLRNDYVAIVAFHALLCHSARSYESSPAFSQSQHSSRDGGHYTIRRILG